MTESVQHRQPVQAKASERFQVGHLVGDDSQGGSCLHNVESTNSWAVNPWVTRSAGLQAVGYCPDSDVVLLGCHLLPSGPLETIQYGCSAQRQITSTTHVHSTNEAQ